MQILWVTTIGPLSCPLACDKSPSPSVFAYCKRSKTGGRKVLGTRLLWFLIYPAVSATERVWSLLLVRFFNLRGETIMTILLFRCFALGLPGGIPRAIINKSACSQLSLIVQHFFLDTCNKPIKRKVCFFVFLFFFNYALNRYSFINQSLPFWHQAKPRSQYHTLAHGLH